MRWWYATVDEYGIYWIGLAIIAVISVATGIVYVIRQAVTRK